MPAEITQTTFAPFVPTSIPGCVLWLRADLGITLATGVSVWADQSGNGNHGLQPTSGSQPSYISKNAAYNGNPTLSFAGGQQFGPAGQSIITPTSITLSPPYTLIAVGNEADAAGSLDTWFTPSALVAIYDNTTSGDAIVYAGGNISTTTTVKAPSIIAASCTSSAQSVYVNSSSSPTTATNTPANIFNGGYVGTCVGALGINAFTGNIAEVILYSSALNVQQIKMLFTYASSRYGFSAS